MVSYELCGIALIILKCLGVITWPWVWVTSPLWIPSALAVCLAVVVFMISFVVVGLTGTWETNRNADW